MLSYIWLIFKKKNFIQKYPNFERICNILIISCLNIYYICSYSFSPSLCCNKHPVTLQQHASCIATGYLLQGDKPLNAVQQVPYCKTKVFFSCFNIDFKIKTMMSKFYLLSFSMPKNHIVFFTNQSGEYTFVTFCWKHV